jgi:integrase
MNRGEGWAPYPGAAISIRESQRERWPKIYRSHLLKRANKSKSRERVGLSGTDPERAYREIQFEKAASDACKLARVTHCPIYTFRHTCLTRWAAYMDPYTLGFLAGHSGFATIRRHVHPQAHTIMEAIERARNAQGGHTVGHTSDTAVEGPKPSTAAIQ